MASLKGLDIAGAKPMHDFGPLPEAQYRVRITESEWKKNKKGTGEHLQFTFEVTHGPYKNRRIWHRLNLKHDDARTVEIAISHLAAICLAVRVAKPRDSGDLHNILLLVSVGRQIRKDTGALENVIRGFAPCGALPRTGQDDDDDHEEEESEEEGGLDDDGDGDEAEEENDEEMELPPRKLKKKRKRKSS